MSDPIESDHHTPLGGALQKLLQADDKRGPSIGNITQAVGEKGFGLVLMVLSLPSALPVPAPGYSTPFGIAIALIAIQMMMGRETIALPERMKRIRIRPSLARKMLGVAAKFLQKIERIIKPRHQWIGSRAGQAWLATVILIMSCLMMLPIPLTNTFPAMVIFLIGVGLSEEDGLLSIGAFGIGFLAVLLYGWIIYVLLTQGPEAIEGMKDVIKGWLGTASA